MRSKLFAGSALAAVLTVAAGPLAGGFTKSPAGVQPAPSCCTEADCCPECILCCSLDGCCEECIQCCIEMGCDPLCCFPGLTAKAAPQACKASGSCCPSAGCCGK